MAGVGAFTVKSPRIKQRHQSERFGYRAPMLEMIWVPCRSELEQSTSLSRSVNARDHPTSVVGILPNLAVAGSPAATLAFR
jgi:hypothetical protein